MSKLASFVLALAACDMPDAAPDADALGLRGGKEPETPPPSKEGGGKEDGPSLVCDEVAFEKSQPYPPGFAHVPGLADLPVVGAACEALEIDEDVDGVVEGQELCDDLVAAAQGLPVGSSHFVVFPSEKGLQCGCTCAERPVCKQPSHYKTYDAVGSGTYAEPFEIWTAEQLWDLAHQPGAGGHAFVQCRDIDLDPFYADGWPYFFVPELSGSYDGRGHRLLNFTYDVFGVAYEWPLDPADELAVGLFGRLSGAVHDLELVDAQVRLTPNYNQYLGAIAGVSEGADLWRLTIDGGVWATNTAGGVSGIAFDSRASDLDLVARVRGASAGGAFGLLIGLNGATVGLHRVTALIEGDGGSVGGIVGYAHNIIARDLHVAGSVTANDSAGGAFVYFAGDGRRISADVEVSDVWGGSTGGLIGSASDGSLQEARASGNVSGRLYVGGLIGSIAQDFTVRDAYATGDVGTSDFFEEATGRIGGFVGSTAEASVSIERCYSSGSIAGNYGPYFINNGGFAGVGGFSTVRDSFATGAVTGDFAVAFGSFGPWNAPTPVDPSNRYNSDVSPISPDQGTPASLASGVFSTPNASFGWSWPVGPGGWTFTPGALPTLTDVP